MAVFKTILERLYVMMNEKKNAHQRGLKILGVISVTFFLFAFSLTAFSQDSTPSESKVELADGKIRIKLYLTKKTAGHKPTLWRVFKPRKIF